MTEIDHRQAYVLIQQEARTAAEERALNEHLAGCSDCRSYAGAHRELQQSLRLDIAVPELNRAEIRQLSGEMARRARRKQQMNGFVGVLRPVLAGGLAVALLVWALALFARPATAPEPAAVGAAPDPTATPTATPEPTVTPTATPEPTATPTATPEPTADALDNLIAVDLRGAETQAHPQINESRFNMTPEEAQQEVSFAVGAPTLLPDGFVFAGAGVTDGTVTQFFVLDGVAPSPVVSLDQREGFAFTPGRDDQQDAEGVTVTPVEGMGEDGVYYVDGVRGVTALAWTEGDISYKLQVSGAIWSVERLQALAESVRPLTE